MKVPPWNRWKDMNKTKGNGKIIPEGNSFCAEKKKENYNRMRYNV
jgi:hypothetical protein